MNQNFGFLVEMEQLLMNGQKKRTMRSISPFRLKCRPMDRMHCFTNYRRPSQKKLFDAIVIERPSWSIEDAPETERKASYKPVIDFHHKDKMIIKDKTETWLEFALADGFQSYNQFYEYFSNHKKKKKVFLAFIFEPLFFNLMYRKITEYIVI